MRRGLPGALTIDAAQRRHYFSGQALRLQEVIMAKNIRLASGETTVAGTLASYTVEAGDSQLRIKCAKDSAVALRWQVKDGVVITDDITASTGNTLAAGEGWVLEPDVGELQVIGESGTATYEVTISRG